MLITLATLKLAVSVLSIVCVTLAAVAAFTAYSVDRLNRDVSRLVGDVGQVRSGLKTEANARQTWLDHILGSHARLHKHCAYIRDEIDSVDDRLTDRVNKLDEYLMGSERTCEDLGGDFLRLGEALSEVSSSLFGASVALSRAASRYRGEPADGPDSDRAEADGDVSRGVLVERYGEDVCTIDDEDEDDEIPF